MDFDYSPPLERERADTDESLRLERARTDESVVEEQTSAAEDTDAETADRRSKSDDALDGQRARADAKHRVAGAASDSAETKRLVAKERGQTDDLLDRERAAADTSLTKERAERTDVAERLLARERDRTDRKLDDERVETDSVVAGHRSEIEVRKQSEEALKQQHVVKDELLSVVSHDLRNPLSVILMNAALIGQHAAAGEIGERVRRWAETTLRSGRHMQRLVSDLLDSAAIKAGALSIVPRRAEAGAIVRGAVESSAPLADGRGIALTGDGGRKDLFVLCDPERVAQVLTNLLDNAIKHTPRGGAIEVKVRSDADGVRFSVTDTGAGIPAKDLDRVFERGWQAVKGQGGGLGLGLYVARGIVRAQQGSMGVESEPGRGTTFWFTLPRA